MYFYSLPTTKKESQQLSKKQNCLVLVGTSANKATFHNWHLIFSCSAYKRLTTKVEGANATKEMLQGNFAALLYRSPWRILMHRRCCHCN